MKPVHKKKRVLWGVVAFVVMVPALLMGCSVLRHKAPSNLDTAWWADRVPIETALYPDYTTVSCSVPMRDCVELAIAVYLPKGLAPGVTIPAIIHQTRYYRAIDYRWPLGQAIGQPEQESIDRFTAAGYAFINVDARGSGASGGTRKAPWGTDEVKDGAQVVDWIICQPWSNGIVGAAGVSYAGTTAEMLLVNQHPAVKAAVLRFSLFDAYTDIAYPGGIYHEWFIQYWSDIVKALDQNDPAKALGFYVNAGMRGVLPLDNDTDGALLAMAVADHADNYDPVALTSQARFRDSLTKDGISIDDFSPHNYLAELRRSKVAIYSYSGWFDGAYAHAAIKRYLNVKNPGSKLVLGPWPHDGFDHLMPFAPTRAATFDQVGETIRYFDFHLKGYDRGIKDEAPIHYYTMGQEKWKAAWSWPPKHTPVPFYLNKGKTLSRNPSSFGGLDVYEVDLNAGSGTKTRWESLANIKGDTIGYPFRKLQDRLLLTYTSAPLGEPAEVTGHPIVTLFADSTTTDGQFFVYLEDVDPDGRVSYVTEGMLNSIHRKISDEKPPYKMVVPYRTYKKEDARPMVPGQVAELTFDLLPVSYLYKKGHSIRIAIAGADKDHFELPSAESIYQIHWADKYPSRILLPVVPHDIVSSQLETGAY